MPIALLHSRSTKSLDRPKIVFDALVHLSMQLLEPLRVQELGVDDGGSAGQRDQRCGKVREALRSIGTIARVEHDGAARLVHLHAVAIELHS